MKMTPKRRLVLERIAAGQSAHCDHLSFSAAAKAVGWLASAGLITWTEVGTREMWCATDAGRSALLPSEGAQ